MQVFDHARPQIPQPFKPPQPYRTGSTNGMSNRKASMLSRSRTESWVESIPLGSLDQLLNVLPDNISHEQVQTHAMSIPLPDSRPESINRSLTKDPSTAVSIRPRSSVTHVTASAPDRSSGGRIDQCTETVPASIEPLASGSVIRLTMQAANEGSLWQLENAGSAAQNGRASNLSSTAGIPLPSPVASRPNSISIAVASIAEHDQSPSPPPAPPNQQALVPPARSRGKQRKRRTYWQQIAPLVKCLPQLKIVNPSRGRHRAVGAITCIDYIYGINEPSVRDDLAVINVTNTEDLFHRIEDMRRMSDPKVATRVVLVEDLCPRMIDGLGSTFRIDPEFFAEHLTRSGYDGVDYEDEIPGHLETYNLPKAHACTKWYRPVQQNPQITEYLMKPRLVLSKRLTDRRGNIKRGSGGLTWLEDDCEHHAVASTNIFRRSWPLSTRPIKLKEERIRPARWMMGYAARREKQEAAEADDLTSESSGDSDDGSGWKSRPIPTAWEEKASCFRYSEAGAPPIIILLLDPLPMITDYQLEKVQHRQALPSEAPLDTEPMAMCIPMVPRIPVDFPSNKFEATREDIARLESSTEILPSTAGAIHMWAHRSQLNDWSAFRADPILALLRVVQIDSKSFFQNLGWALDEISQDSLDDYLMTRRLADWRRLMSDFEIEVPAIVNSLRGFVDFVFQDVQQQDDQSSAQQSSGRRKDSIIPEEIKDIVEDLDADITRLKERLDEAYTALRADMQFTESRRSIAEAKTVTKLTELAFLFIPLSFTCSLFSMSIVELQNGVAVWVFVVTAVAIALLSYGIRLLLTSDVIADNSRAALEKLWAKPNVRRGESVSGVRLALLTMQELFDGSGPIEFVFRGFFVVVVAAIVVVPVAFMWTSTKLDIGFNIAMTFFLVLSSLACAWFAILLGNGGMPGFLTYGSTESDTDISV